MFRRASLWFVILLLALGLRVYGSYWDGGIGAHPDERRLVGVAERMVVLDHLDPLAIDPGFPYGHLPLYLLVLMGGEDQLLAARLLVALLETGTVVLAGGLGIRLGGRNVGALAAALLAVMPLHVQQAHFGVADSFLAFFTTGALLFLARLAEEGRAHDAALAGVCTGLAVGCKAGAALLILPLVAALVAGADDRWGRGRRAILAGSGALVAFVATNPFALAHPAQYLANLANQAALVRGAAEAPYTIQYQGTLPYVYPIGQQLWWGMGPVAGGLCFAGLAAAVREAVRRPVTGASWVGLAWALPFFSFTGALCVKFPRYLLPLTPVLAVHGGQLVDRLRGCRRWMGWVAGGLATGTAAVLSLGLVLSYREPHPWVEASDWLESRLSPGAVVAGEEWDHPLPLNGAAFDIRTLPVYAPDSPEKWEGIEEVLAEAEAVVIASRRGYAALVRLEGRFRDTAEYYRALLTGGLGFEVVACFERWPRLGPLTVLDDPFTTVGLPRPAACVPAGPALWLPRLDESFVVYDHPVTIVLWRTDRVVGSLESMGPHVIGDR